MTLLKHLLEDLVGLLFPNLCCGCGIHLHRGELELCTKCLYQLPYTDHHLHLKNKAAKQLWGRLPCNAAMSLLYFKKGGRTQSIIHHLKYKGRMDLGIKLGGMIASKLQMNPVYDGIDLIIPVPLHPGKERLRGYNQSLCIAEGISEVLNVPVSSKCLLRISARGSQTKKGRYKRFENIRSVFSIAHMAELRGKHVLLVDDVLTTGATLEACGIVLLEGQIGKLSIATIAYSE